ncbi:NAD-dependent epimerase/dehydratase family protein [Roseivivax sediminis]|uniref:Nucleoside-diphosphate-sugar epimerase n=1 Tax=Roseivivax sediminis TaxID=936889 RepID=A0A1I1YXJ6_9RHOB|nr:NAD(P)-dependent oxidoreductase [Roseivivax sediminis]SFE22893.1 Nucleoside-diphosphate-sugar epimerase [Roseivivax sediminis]
MRVAITGATGYVGRFFVAAALARGHEVTALTRSAPEGPVRHLPYDLSAPVPDLTGHDLLVHTAFAHVPGRYRGGEGEDPAGFLAANLGGTRRLFEAAVAAGVPRVAFLSSRAVFDGLPGGTHLPEDLPPEPASLYGKAKLSAEEHLAALPLTGWSLRATGVFGLEPSDLARPAPPAWRKWHAELTEAFAGHAPDPRRGTEVHGRDLADALFLLAEADAPGGPVHVSDILLDRRELIEAAAAAAQRPLPLPETSDAPVSALGCGRLSAFGWAPSGRARLHAEMPALLSAYGLA